MLNDPTCFDKLATIAVASGVATFAAAGLAPPPGVLESVAAGGGLLGLLRGRRALDRDALAARLRDDLAANWEAWGETASMADPGRRASAVASFEEVIGRCAPPPGALIGQRLDAEAIARLMLAEAARLRPEVFADANPRNADAHLARGFFLKVTTRAYARLFAEPDFIDRIAPDLWRGLFDAVDEILRLVRDLHAERDTTEAPIRLKLTVAQKLAVSFGAQTADILDPARLERFLEESADRRDDLAARLTAPSNEDDPAVRRLRAEAAALIEDGRFEEADARLTEAEARAEAAEREAEEALDRRKRSRAASRAERGDLARLRLAYREAAEHYARAARITPAADAEQRWSYALRRASTLYALGREFGDNAALEESIAVHRGDALPLAPRTDRPLDWARTQNNLGNALFNLGEREAGTETLREAVAAYRAALEERSRDRVPLDWAATQTNIGNALGTLGEREAGTETLREAVAAFRAALEEPTRDRVPLDWAATQNNLGNALRTLGEREAGTETLREAVAAFRAALEERTRGPRPPRLGRDPEQPRHRPRHHRRTRGRDRNPPRGRRRLPRRP